jgi:hypothetical protein
MHRTYHRRILRGGLRRGWPIASGAWPDRRVARQAQWARSQSISVHACTNRERYSMHATPTPAAPSPPPLSPSPSALSPDPPIPSAFHTTLHIGIPTTCIYCVWPYHICYGHMAISHLTVAVAVVYASLPLGKILMCTYIYRTTPEPYTR